MTLPWMHFDPDGRLRRHLDQWFPPQRLSLAAANDAYRGGGSVRRRPPAWAWPDWGDWERFRGPLLLCDSEVSLPGYPWSMRPPQWKINSLWIPTGAGRSAIGLFLCPQRLDRGTPVELTLPLADEQTWTIPLEVLVSLPFTVPPPQPTAADRGSFLAVLVDRRYRERHAMARIDASHYWAGIQAALPMSDRIEGSAAAPLPPEPWLWQRHLPAGVALDALAAATGRRVVYDLSADRYRLQSHDDAVAAFDRNRQMAIDTSIASFAFDAPMGIGELSVSFPRALLIREGVATLHPEAARDRRLRALDGAAGWTAYCSLPVLYDTQGNVLNEGDIQAAATAIANYYDQWRNRAYQYHASLPPTARWELCGFDDYLWLSWDQDRRGRYFPKAIVSSLPPECLPIDWPWGGLPGEPSSSSSSSSSSGSEPPSGDSQSGGGGGCPDGTSATLDVLVADPTRSGGFLEFPKKRLVFSGGCLTAVEDREPLKVWVCCDSEPPPSSSDGSSEGSSEGSTDPDPFDPEQDWVVEDCETQQRVRLHASVGQQWQLGAVIDWEAAGISRRCGRLVGNNSWSAVAYDWTIHASYATCEECASGSSSSSSDGSSEPGEHDYVVEDCQTGTKSRIFVPVIAEVGQVIRWRLGPSGDPRCGVVKPSGTTPEETFYFGVDLLGLYSDCNSCLN